MKTRAAVARAPGKVLSLETVDIDGPKAGEVMVEVKATGICHTDEYTLSGADPEGLFPAILGHEGAGIVVEVGPGVTSAEKRRPRDPALHAGMPQLQVLPVAQDQSLHRDPRDPGQGRDAGRHLALLLRGRAGDALHGLLDLREFHGAAGDRGGESARGRAVRKNLLYRLRRHHRHRRGDQHRESAAGRQCRGVRPRRHRPQRRSRARAWPAPT